LAQDVKKEVDAAIEQAKKGSPPADDMLTRNIYRAPIGSTARGVQSGSRIKLL
jgi:hypothetical protein